MFFFDLIQRNIKAQKLFFILNATPTAGYLLLCIQCILYIQLIRNASSTYFFRHKRINHIIYYYINIENRLKGIS